MEGLQISSSFIQRIFSRVLGIPPLPVSFQTSLYLHNFNFKNNYHEKLQKKCIGKGAQVENLDIVKVTLRVEELLQHKHKHEFKGKEYVNFEVAKMQKPDDFKRTHTAYALPLKRKLRRKKLLSN